MRDVNTSLRPSLHDRALVNGHYWSSRRAWGRIDPTRMRKKLSNFTVSFLAEAETYAKSVVERHCRVEHTNEAQALGGQ